MKNKIYAVIIITLNIVLLTGCSQKPPQCSNENTLTLVRKIILEQIGDIERLSDKELQENMKIEYPRASAFDENIKKYNCEARLVAGNSYQVSIFYESQLDDNNQHIVSLRGMTGLEKFYVKYAIIKNVRKNRAEAEAAVKAVSTSTINSESGADASKNVLLGEYLFDVLKKPEYKKSWNELIDGEKNVDAWLANFAKTKHGVSTPAKKIKIGTDTYQINSVCKPHDCGNNQFYVIFAPSGTKAWGILLKAGMEERFFGKPDEKKKTILRNAAAKE